MRVLIVGANGQLGTDLVEEFGRAGHEIIASVFEDLDITDPHAVRQRLNDSRPAVVINTAAYTHVDKCESMDETAFRINALAVRTLAETCNRIDASLVQISTDYVFDGTKREPYVEDDPTNPRSVYAITKLAGEHYATYTSRHFIVRISGLYGRHPSVMKGYNFVEKILQLARERDEVKVVDDEFSTPTFALDVARNLVALVESEAFGLYHMTNNGACSWFEFASQALRLAGVDTPLAPIPASTWPSPVRRPAYSVLENRNLHRLNLDRMPHWRDALAEYMQITGRVALEVED